eukprot:CAMPEP_0169288740 /NCGR_PEP_ID=MMETSP1016-20121227/60730_1 /TAXON_ID=342587 /ORGANISM="Karlodinium micrum, Strain CCMP2283" /LENGTH=139 /DNA_ID=CAMNT_0009379009 /DNA_START=39 /DNA_END=456 /DNA_ORIENTATION=+
MPLSPRREASPLSDKGALGVSPRSSVLNFESLEDIFDESEKLEDFEAKSATARKELSGVATSVCDFMHDHSPQTYSNLGPDQAGEGFASRVLPKFFSIVDRDKRALEDVATLLGNFADKHFPRNDDLLDAREESSPLPL